MPWLTTLRVAALTFSKSLRTEVELRSRLEVKQGMHFLIKGDFGHVALRKTHGTMGSYMRTRQFGNNTILSPEILLGC